MKTSLKAMKKRGNFERLMAQTVNKFSRLPINEIKNQHVILKIFAQLGLGTNSKVLWAVLTRVHRRIMSPWAASFMGYLT